MVTVFISYVREDQELVLRLYDDLKQAGAAPWIDQKNILPGQDWEYEIKKEMKNSDRIVIIFSTNSVNKRGYFQKEVRMALDLLDEMPPGQTLLIPCRADDVDIPHEVKILERLDFFPSYSDSLQTLKLAIGISAPEVSEFEAYRELMMKMDQNLLKYQLYRANILNQPLIFNNPTWISEVWVQTDKTIRRLYETITRVQKIIPMYNYVAEEIGNNKFLLKFKHIKNYGDFSHQFERLLNNEGVQVLEAGTKKDEVPIGHSAAVIPDDDAEAIMIRGSNGRPVIATSEGAYDTDTGEKVSDDELANLSPNGGFNITKG